MSIEEQIARTLADAAGSPYTQPEHSYAIEAGARALTAVSAERDRLHKAIIEALDWRDEAYHGAFGRDDYAQGYGYARRAIGRILRAALDKEAGRDGHDAG